MVLAVKYQTSRVYLKYQLDREFSIDNEDEVVVKILNLFDIATWLKLHGYHDESKKGKENELRANIHNEISIYSHIWRYNNSLQNKDSTNFINVPKLVHYGEASEKPLKRLDLTYGDPQIDKELEASRDFNIRCLYGPYLVQCMRASCGAAEHNEVEKELEKLQKIGVTYVDRRDSNFWFDPRTQRAYIVDFEYAQLTV
ncbi:unnamed protein product [Ambrosiozyma monospora]|uniref:Unnamed protein product n=1 Tax=Ambrosiozyma monospora TaxID=43982 RepID=A0ACB5SXS1_AMBMO|nr:unnamed protein product [Ambrosiozyma monospora]